MSWWFPSLLLLFFFSLVQLQSVSVGFLVRLKKKKEQKRIKRVDRAL